MERFKFNIDKGFATLVMTMHQYFKAQELPSNPIKDIEQKEFIEKYGSWEFPDPETITPIIE